MTRTAVGSSSRNLVVIMHLVFFYFFSQAAAYNLCRPIPRAALRTRRLNSSEYQQCAADAAAALAVASSITNPTATGVPRPATRRILLARAPRTHCRCLCFGAPHLCAMHA